MNQQKLAEYTALLHSEISPALGCTEPAAAALAVAYAAALLDRHVIEVQLEVSAYIFKNGMNVGIPGTGMLGLDIAAALGAVSAEPQKGLMVLNDLSVAQKDRAKAITAQKKVSISLAKTNQRVYLKAVVTDGTDTAEAIISGTHTNLIYLRKNDTVIEEKEPPSDMAIQSSSQTPEGLTVRSILEFANTVPVSELSFLEEVIFINNQISKEGLQNDYGLRVGKSMLGGSGDVLLSGGVVNYAVACTAAAADARMSGCNKPVMSAAGSGNQGLTATIPVAAVGEKMFCAKDRILRALAISILVTVHTKQYIGRLSVLCGCSIAAAIGACCGTIYLLNGSYETMTYGINTMIADISGVICDGAKPGCALKIATAVNSAMRAATMALNGVGADGHDGIVSSDAEISLQNLGKLGNEGMAGANNAILGMMMGNQTEKI